MPYMRSLAHACGKIGLPCPIFIPFVVRPPHYRPSWPILSSCLDGMILTALTKPLSMMPRYLGTDDCTSANHIHLQSRFQYMQFPYHYTDQTPAYLIFLLSDVTWFGFLVSLHYYDDPLSCLLHIQNSLHCRLFSVAHSRFPSKQHVVLVLPPKISLFSLSHPHSTLHLVKAKEIKE